MKVLDGKLLSAKIKDEVKANADSYKQTPIIAVITIGENELCDTYTKSIRSTCEYVGISMMHFDYASVVKESVVIKKIKELNKDNSVNGIILQLPIPENFNLKRIVNTISESKDIDGLNDNSSFISCTTSSILEMLDYYKIVINDKHTIIIGNSKSLVDELIKRNSIVTICNNTNYNSVSSSADIIIVLDGFENMIDDSIIKNGSILIDASYNKYSCISTVKKPSYISDGVSQMNTIMLLKNLMISYENQNK